MLKSLHNIGASILRYFGNPEIVSDGFSHKRCEIFEGNAFSQILPYQAYDEENGIFLGKESLGFVIETLPLVGTDKAIQKEIESIFQEILEEGDSIQCLLLADPRTNDFLNQWEQSRKHSSHLCQEIAKKRRQFFEESSEISPRLFRFILSYSISCEGNVPSNLIHIENLKIKRDKILKILTTMTYAFSWKVSHLLNLVSGMTSLSKQKQTIKRTWNRFQSISSQMSQGDTLSVKRNQLEWCGENVIIFRSYRVAESPSYWTLNGMQKLIGDMHREAFRIDVPFYIHYGVHCPKQSKVGAEFWRRSQLVEKQGRSYTLLRMIPNLEIELKENDYVRKALNQGARFVWTQLSAGIWGEEKEITQAEQALKSIFRINEFNLIPNNLIHLPQFIASLPLTWGEYASQLKNLDVLKTTTNLECGNFIPIQGEWVGTSSPGMLFLGRRGQLTNWNPFDNKTGNYNVSIAGRSGSGKSVFMQDLLLNGLGVNAKVFVIDVGRSFEHMCEFVNGQQIEFSENSKICLNPFSKLHLAHEKEIDSSLNFIKSIVAYMAAPTNGTSDYENVLISNAVRHVWREKKNQATITDIASYLRSQEEQTAVRLGVMLTPYTKEGAYAHYFEGENNVNFNNQMVLIELEELKSKPDLQSVILQLFIVSITNQAFLGDRKTRFIICIDEAWDLLRGKQAGEFIEVMARRLRKYNGSLVIGTQNVEDFLNSDGAKAAFKNSDWIFLLAQDQKAIKSLSEVIDLSNGRMEALESVHTVHGKYSDLLMIEGQGNHSILRLFLDKFSRILCSTKAEEFTRIKDLKAQGLSISEAVNRMVMESENQP